jgi:hypothetical protein
MVTSWLDNRSRMSRSARRKSVMGAPCRPDCVDARLELRGCNGTASGL